MSVQLWSWQVIESNNVKEQDILGPILRLTSCKVRHRTSVLSGPGGMFGQPLPCSRTLSTKSLERARAPRISYHPISLRLVMGMQSD